MPVTDEAIEKIKEMIVTGQLRPGDRLPREADLSVQLGLSRNSLREAVRALSLLNVLDVRQGDGTYVSPLDSSRLLEALTFLVDLHRDDSVLESFQVRAILEPAAAALATHRIDLAERASLRTLLDSLGSAPTVDEVVANDIEFHHRIAAAAGNTMLCSLIDSLSGPTVRARIWRGITQEGALERTVAEHGAILDAMGSGDAEAARAWMTVHITGVTRWLQEAP
ncbi:FadR/GntR family transcriptional regulator [Streptomyces oceani]|uniref:GntR family transcriptional regulator n=1 Tax=Streptomyces oceani TaxID=1075402 RepID=A0A1E7KJU8_9ACTN|nr:FadR/GntR family transcriptional regulator [Streptomyces oceani]OEV04117.1 GntR family transcriptional regulator [Streptomyces oceani]